MLTLISTALGLFGSAIPKAIDYFNKKQEHEQQMDLLRLQSELATQRARDGITIEQIRSENNRLAESLKIEKAAVANESKWISNLRASVRPVITYLFMFVFIAVEATAIYLGISSGADWREVVSNIWHHDVSGVFAAIIAFWFGSRALNSNIGVVKKK